MNFAEPIWLLGGLITCGALVWAWLRYDLRQRAALAFFVSTHLHEELTVSISTVKRTLRRGLFLFAIALIFVALARPLAGFRWEEVKRRGVEIMFAVDTSRSMLTPDVKPDRLTRAKMAVEDFVSHLNGDGVGLVAFAGNAFLQCPITLDYDAFHDSLDALDTHTIPRGGTNISSAIRETEAALQKRESTDKIMVLLTDGEDLEGDALVAAKEAAKDGLKIYTVGVGTKNGDLIALDTDSGGGFLKDDTGQFVKSQLDEAGLKAIAEATGGLYAPLGSQGEGLETIYQQALVPLAKHDLASRRQRIYTERYQWPLGLALVLLLSSLVIGSRRRVARKRELVVLKSSKSRLISQEAATLLGLMFLLPFNHSEASVSSAERAYQKGDYATAQREYAAAVQRDPGKPELAFNAGDAAYKKGDYPDAVKEFQQSLATQQSGDAKRLATQEDTYYNLGNTLYRTGQTSEKSNPQQTIQSWEQAVKTYDVALQLRADDTDTKFNRDFVQRKLDELKKQQQKQQDQKNQGNKDQKQDQKSGSTSKQDQDQQKNPQDQSGQEDQANNKQNKDQKPGVDSKPDQQKDQQQASNSQQDQKPQPTEDKPQGDTQSNGTTDQKKDEAQQGSDSQRVAGEMSKQEAKNLLDSLKGDERRYPVGPLSRNGTPDNQQDKPYKDW